MTYPKMMLGDDPREHDTVCAWCGQLLRIGDFVVIINNEVFCEYECYSKFQDNEYEKWLKNVDLERLYGVSRYD